MRGRPPQLCPRPARPEPQKRLPNTACSFVRSSRPAVTTAFRKASSTSISSWAERRQGMTGENLLRICESRLDNVVYLLGWASSRAEARQLTTPRPLSRQRQKGGYPLLPVKGGRRGLHPPEEPRQRKVQGQFLKQTLPAPCRNGWTKTPRRFPRKSLSCPTASRSKFLLKNILSSSSIRIIG